MPWRDTNKLDFGMVAWVLQAIPEGCASGRRATLRDPRCRFWRKGGCAEYAAQPPPQTGP